MKTGIKLLGLLTVLAAVAVLVGCDRRHDDHADHDHTAHQAAEAAADAGEQTLCPVMNAPINKQYVVEYEGKKVYFCCPGCDKAFLEDPEKYLDKLPQFQQ
jgi:membrane fusion protein, copper/silver efflux system